MATKYRPITQKEKVKEIGIGFLLALIFATALGGIAQLLFQWGAGFFDPAPNAPPDCKFSDFFDGSVGTLDAYQACKDQSRSFPIRMERLSDKIPWFWIAFVLLSWAFNRNPLKGRKRDDSDRKRYDGQLGWEFVSYVIGHITFFFIIWFLLLPSLRSGIALAIGIGAIIFWVAIDKWLLNKYGMTNRERQEKAQTSPLIEALVQRPKR
jgi:hypothetical protein